MDTAARLPIASGRTAPAARSEFSSTLSAFLALLLRDMAVLKKDLGQFLGRTVIQPLLLVFVFLFVFPNIGQGVGAAGGPEAQSFFATILVAGVVGLSIMMQGIQAVALPLAMEFGITREIEDRVLAPMPVAIVALEKVAAGAIQGLIAAVIVFPIAAVVHSSSVHIHLAVHWLVLITLFPLVCVMCASLGLFLGTKVQPRFIAAMFGFIVLPMAMLGGTYYPWTQLSVIKVGGFSWLQAAVLLNPLIFVTEGFRAALTKAPHMHLYIVYPAMLGFTAVFLLSGIKNFKRRVVS